MAGKLLMLASFPVAREVDVVVMAHRRYTGALKCTEFIHLWLMMLLQSSPICLSVTLCNAAKRYLVQGRCVSNIEVESKCVTDMSIGTTVSPLHLPCSKK